MQGCEKKTVPQIRSYLKNRGYRAPSAMLKPELVRLHAIYDYLQEYRDHTQYPDGAGSTSMHRVPQCHMD